MGPQRVASCHLAVTPVLVLALASISPGSAAECPHGSFAGVQYHPVPSSQIRAMVLADFNQDGNLDAAGAGSLTTGGSAFWVLPGDGTGGLGPPSTTFPLGLVNAGGIVAADFNGDGKSDVAVATEVPVGPSYRRVIAVFLGNGSGGFAPPLFTDGGTAGDLKAGDLDADGKMDLVTAKSNNTIDVLLGNGAGGFSSSSVALPGAVRSVVIGDFNGDGKADVAAAVSTPHRLSVLLGNGAGGFGAPVSHILPRDPLSITSADFNADGKLDVAIGNNASAPAAEAVTVLLGSGTGSFSSVGNFPATNPHVLSITNADFNLDGKIDLAATAVGTGLGVLLGNGAGGFGSAIDVPMGANPNPVAAGDLNHDGSPDVAVAAFGGVSTGLGDGQGGFGVPTSLPASLMRSVVIADFTNDGQADVAAAGTNIAVFHANGSGGFAAPVSSTPPFEALAMADGDLNSDGSRDIATLNSARCSVHLGNGTGALPYSASFTASLNAADVALGDFNGDLKPDIVVMNKFPENSVSVFLREAGGGYSPPVTTGTVPTPSAPVVSDFDGDGKVDLAVTAGFGPQTVEVLHGVGNGSFDSSQSFPIGPPLSGGPRSLAAGDLNGDGRIDLIAGRAGDSQVWILLGTAGGSFAPAVGVAMGASEASLLAAADFNADGKLDVAALSQSSGAVFILLGNGAGSLTVDRAFAVGHGEFRMAAGHLDCDANPDLAVLALGATQRVLVLFNTCGGLGLPTTVTGIAPASGSEHGGTPVTITGSNFRTGATVSLGGVAATNVSVLGPATITATTGPHPPGAVDVAVTNPAGPCPSVPAVLAGGYTYLLDVPADLAIGKTGPVGVTPGQDVAYTITVTNGGPGSAASVSVADPTPPALAFVSNSGSCVTAFPCALGSIAAGQSRTITATLRVPPSYAGANPIQNTATVTSSTSDPNPTNDSSTTVTPVNPPSADLAITKIGPIAFAFASNLTYLLTVTNNGPSDATTVVVEDPTPTGLAFVSNSGSCFGAFPCNIGTVAPGQDKTITTTFFVPVDYVGPDPVLNTATANASTADPSSTNNTATSSTPGPVATSFHTATPCRVVDTRGAAGPTGGPALAAGGERTFPVGGRCGIPLAARAVSVNVAVVNPTATGNLRTYPPGTTSPFVSTINYSQGQTRSNNAIVALSPSGELNVRCAQASGTVHVVIDVNGWFE